MASKYNITPPDLNECKSYEAYKRELSAWAAVTELAKVKQGNYVVLSLPNKSKFGNDLKERAFECISAEDLVKEDGLERVKEFLNKELGKNAVDDVIEKWDEFDNCKKTDSQSLEDFINDFEVKYNRIKATGTKLPEEILAYMLMKRAGLKHIEKMLILSRIDIEDKTNLFKDVKTNMKNILGKRLQDKVNEDQIRLEPTFLAQNEDVLATHGYYRNRAGTYPFKSNKQNKNFKKQGKFQQSKDKKPLNPLGKDGKPYLCKSCGSFRHLVAQCPDSFENSKQKGQAFVTEEVSSDESSDEPEDINRFVLFTSDSDELSRFTSEAVNAAALDTCCTTSVAGENWLKIYLDSLPKEFREKVEGPFKGDKWFQFGNQGVLKSIAKYVIPAVLGNRNIFIEIEIISSDIPLLLSKSAMKRAEMIIYLSEDSVEVFGQKMILNTTSAGHYVVPLLPKADEIGDVDNQENEEVLAVDLLNLDEKSKTEALLKLHKQFGHRPKESFIKLLKSANCWDSDMSNMIDQIIDNCEGCIKRKRNPDRPAVAMPMAMEFNEKLAIDLSFYNNKIILHMIDMWSRLSVSVQINRKKPSEVIDSIMSNWVAYFGIPGSILNDNGGEFTSDEIREVKSILNVHDLTTGAESPWQNGLCEKNHALIDNILERLDDDFPDTDLKTKLAWAGMAKNSLQMTYGYSPNQLVFGQNPKLPNILSDGPPSWEESTTSEIIAKHLNTLHSARKAFIQSECSARLKTALKSKIRTNNEVYDYGDVVYYRRMKDNKWHGPARVIFQDGKVIFIRHGAIYVRVSANRLVKAGQELAKQVEAVSPSKLMTQATYSSSPSKLEYPAGLPKPAVSSKAPEMQLLDDSSDAQLETHRDNPDPVEENHEEIMPPSSSRSAEPNKINLKRNEKIRFKDGDLWKEATIVGRGKATGKYRNWFNVSPADGSENHSVNLEVVEFEKVPETPEDVLMVMIPRDQQSSQDCMDAKMTELKKLADFQTYKEVDDLGQERISCRWVLSKKGSETRARLVARGYEEEHDIPSDSPTLSKAGMRIIVALAAAQDWIIETTDIKSAFLQGSKLDRKVFIKPPKEAQVTHKLWELTKALYGLKDASRQWFFKVKDKLLKLGCIQSRLDPGMFFFKNQSGKLIGTIGLHVDDFLHAGTSDFNNQVIMEINKEFKVGKNEKQNFVYTGFAFTQRCDGISLQQNRYTESLEIKQISPSRTLCKASSLLGEETTMLREAAGALNWVVRGTRPDLSFDLIDISTRFTKGKVEDLIRANKLLLQVKENKAEIFYPSLNDQEDWSILCFTDASLGNLNGGIDSAGGYLVFLAASSSGNTAIIDWQANKIRRVVRSTLAAEALSLCEGLEAAIHVNNLIEEATGRPLQIHSFIDNRSVVDAIRSTTTVDDKRLRRDISAVKEMIETGTVKSVTWVPGHQQLADVLTKRGVNGMKLLQVLHSGKMEQEILQKIT